MKETKTINTNINKVIILKEQNLNKKLIVKSNQIKNLFLIDTINKSFNCQYEIILNTNSTFNLILSSLNKSDYHKQFNIKVFHNKNAAVSKCEVFGVNKDQSQTNFYLEAYIDKKTKQNNCEQRIRGVLLSNECEIQGKPNLIIDTNNIKAKHALAIGKLNDNHLFYLQNKGLKRSDAIKLLLLSYFNVILYHIKDEHKKELLIDKIFHEIGTVE